MFVDFLLESFQANQGRPAIVWNDASYDYGWLLERVHHWQHEVEAHAIKPGTVVILEADFSPNSVALFLALADQGCVLVPLSSSASKQKAEFIEIAQGEISCCINPEEEVEITRFERTANHELYDRLRQLGHPGLVFFSSGSTGKSKAAVHNLLGLLEKYKTPRHRFVTISFLLYDHIGGVNTMLYTLSNTGLLVTVPARTPDDVLRIIEKYRVQLLPTSPTFINLILLSEAYKRYDLSSLEIVSYGTEPMPESTLRRFHELYPKINLVQTYGLSEVGILRSKSKSPKSLWVKVGGEGFLTRVVDGILQIKAESAMLGYLNAASPFTEDGWFNTGDLVETDGEYLKILGRKSELINVGGEKVFPTEVEDIIQQMDNVAEVTVYGEKNPITGSIVCADVTLRSEEDRKQFVARLKKHCTRLLPKYKVPVRVAITERKHHSDRFKKQRV